MHSLTLEQHLRNKGFQIGIFGADDILKMAEARRDEERFEQARLASLLGLAIARKSLSEEIEFLRVMESEPSEVDSEIHAYTGSLGYTSLTKTVKTSGSYFECLSDGKRQIGITFIPHKTDIYVLKQIKCLSDQRIIA